MGGSSKNCYLEYRGWRTVTMTALLICGVAITGCRTKSTPTPPKPPRVKQDSTGGFLEGAAEAGIDFTMNFLPNEQGESFKINLYDHGCGIAVGDYDGDGNDDIYFLNQLGANSLHRNLGDGTFEDATDAAGVALEDRISVGATFADFDNDGDQDLYVTTTRGGNVLFRNEGEGRFVERTKEVGLEHVGHSQTAAFFDYDNDGWLDLYLVQTANWTEETFDEASRYYLGKGAIGITRVLESPIEYNVLYRNNGDGTFADVTDEAGMEGRGWAGDIGVFDYNEDGWQDVLVTSMFGRAQLYRNNGDKTFTDVAVETLGRTPFGAVGSKVFDANNDGRLDVYIVDMHSDMWMGLDYEHNTLSVARDAEKVRFQYFHGPRSENDQAFRKREERLHDYLDFKNEEVVYGNAFYLNRGDGNFDEVSQAANLENFWPWSAAAGDFDNDGFVDVFVASGMGYPFYYWRNHLLMNNGIGLFVEKSFAYGIEPPRAGQTLDEQIAGQDCPRSSRCAATGDFDGDGRLELVVNNFNHEPYYYRNQFSKQNYVALRLTGTRSNRDAIGAVAKVTCGDAQFTRQVHSANGYLSHSSKTLHFGLGSADRIDSVEIRWPSGHVQMLEDVAINKRHEITEPQE